MVDVDVEDNDHDDVDVDVDVDDIDDNIGDYYDAEQDVGMQMYAGGHL